MTIDRRIKRSLAAMITANTKSPPYQNAALSILDTNLKRGLEPQIKTLTCDRCKQPSKVVRWMLDGKIADSWGYVEFDKESVCCACLDEDWIGPIMVPKQWEENAAS